ncbi:MAG: hypothetical protein AAF530_23420 [Pseudomonadota bacterium]
MGKALLTWVALAGFAAASATSGSQAQAASPKAIQNSTLYYSEAVQGPLSKGIEAITVAQAADPRAAERLTVAFTFAYYDRVDAWLARHADPENGTYDSVELQIYLYNWVADLVTAPRFAIAKQGEQGEDRFQAYARQDAGLAPED